MAYARYDATYSDTLAVLVSTDCGTTWTEAWVKGGTTLATAPDAQDFFVPTSAQWREELVQLTAAVGQPEVIVAFEDRGHYGNVVRVDNINLTAVVESAIAEPDDAGGFELYPNPATDLLQLRSLSAHQGPLELLVRDAAGRVVRTASIRDRLTLDVSALSAGSYTAQVGRWTARFTVVR